jgi:hypothetical protein
LRLDAAKRLSLTVGEVVHGRLGKVEAVGGVVDSEDVDGLAIVCDTIAGPALWIGIRVCGVDEGL